MDNPGANRASQAGAVAPVLFCNLCFSRDHSRSACRLVVSAVLQEIAAEAAALPVDEEEEEDPEELVFEEGSLWDEAPPAAAANDFIPLLVEEDFGALGAAGQQLPEMLVIGDGSSDEEGPLLADDAADVAAFHVVAEEDYLHAPDPLMDVLDAEHLEDHVRPDYMDVYMPFVDLRHFDNLSYAFVDPPLPNPHDLMLQAADLGCGPNQVYLYPSSRGARVAVFSSNFDREMAVAHGPYLGRDVSVFFERHEESDNRFVFEHETMAVLSITEYPMEQWHRHQITHSSGPYVAQYDIKMDIAA
jgi:hypothetical protein